MKISSFLSCIQIRSLSTYVSAREVELAKGKVKARAIRKDQGNFSFSGERDSLR